MPLYEYRCEPCGHRFETLIRSSRDVPRCPLCGNVEVAKQFSVPAAAQAGAKASSLPAFEGGCGRPQCGGGFCAGMG
jgi:putative FmdB family regulatory protein